MPIGELWILEDFEALSVLRFPLGSSPSLLIHPSHME